MLVPLLTSPSPLGALPGIGFSVLILLTLALIFAGSWITFWILVLRSTEHRLTVALREWGRERSLRLIDCGEESPPSPLDVISSQRLAMQFCVGDGRTMLVRFESFGPAGQPGPDDQFVRAGIWNVFIREFETPWPATGLRPSSATASALDLFSLTSFPLLGGSERFVVYGTESRAAAALSRSPARGLLPPDVGLMLHGRNLVLDFSGRPFDTIEFERMIAVANQIIAHLPAPETT